MIKHASVNMIFWRFIKIRSHTPLSMFNFLMFCFKLVEYPPNASTIKHRNTKTERITTLIDLFNLYIVFLNN